MTQDVVVGGLAGHEPGLMGHDQRWPHASRCGRAITMNGNYKRRLAVTSVLAMAVSGAVWIAATDASGGPKTYTSVATTPHLTSGTHTASIKMSNTSRNKISFNAINLTIPTGLGVAAPSLSPAVGTATVNGSTLELRDLNTPQGASLTVSFQATASVQSPCATYTFVSDVRQSNDFNGQNNKFALDGLDATMSGPCNSSTVTCTAGDSTPCATGVIESAGGNTASVTVDDHDGISASLTASIAPGALTCAEYTPTSDQLQFGINVTSGDLTGVTKTATFTQHYDGSRQDWQYQACFQAPYDFPALLPSQLAHDFATHDFSGNTTYAAGPPATYTGLLLPCSAGYGIPCMDGVAVINAGGPGPADDTVSITIKVPAADPGARF